MSNPERKLADNLNADRPESSTDNEAFDLMRLMPNQIRYAPAKYLSIKKKLPITSANTAIPKTAKNTKTRSPTTIPAATALPFENPADEERATTKATLVLGTSAKVTIAANRANISPRLIVIPMLNASQHARLRNGGEAAMEKTSPCLRWLCLRHNKFLIAFGAEPGAAISCIPYT